MLLHAAFAALKPFAGATLLCAPMEASEVKLEQVALTVVAHPHLQARQYWGQWAGRLLATATC